MTTPASAEKIQPLPIDESSVIDFLKDNPGLLERHPDVIGQLTFTHETGAAISLVERQLKALRDQNQGYRSKLSELVQIARENEELSQRFHRLSLELMAGDHLDDVIAMTQNQIKTFFSTDYVGFCFHDELASQLKGQEKSILDPASKHAPKVYEWMQQRKPVFGPFDPGLRKLLLTEQDQLNSFALIPLYHTRDIGMLILGSNDKDRFAAGLGSVFLKQLGELISSKIKLYLK